MTRNLRVSIAVVVACVWAAGCSSAVDADPGLRLRTPRSDYSVGAPIPVFIENRLAEDVYVAHCNQRVSLMLQRRVGETWVAYRQTNAPCLAIYPMGDLLVAAGADVTETLQIDEPGNYRLQLYARRAAEDFGSTVVVSGAFRVYYPPD